MSNRNERGFFETILFVGGLITGGMLRFEQGEWGGALIGAIVLGGIGAWVGTLTDKLIKFLVLVAILLLNAAIRQFIWRIIQEVLNAA